MADYIKSSLPIETLNIPGVDSPRVTVGVLDSTGAAINPAKEDGNLASILTDTTAIKNKDFATETTLSSIKTDTTALAAKDFATETTLASVKTDTGAISTNTASIDTKMPAKGQATMANSMPVAIASDQSVINVNVVSAVEANPITVFNTTANVATSSSVTHTYSATGNFVLDKVWASASGKMKVEIKAGDAGSESTLWVGFNSTANPNVDIPCGGPKLSAGQNILVIITNNDNQAMNVYSTISGQNV